MARFENVKATASTANPFEGLTTPEALQKHIVDGIKKGLEPRLDQALQELPALEIINNVLLEGMKTVGELFGAGKMQLPFVLQSAEVMKASVRYLEPHLDRLEGESRGSILLATVAGDVHDIGKNLVDIILSNNGYRVVNIGIKQPINAILEQAQTHRCDVIGMSGLLVKSTVIMRENLLEMNSRGLSDYPVILGGAALTRGYVEQDLRQDYDGRVFYAQDAFEGLKLMAELCENPSENPEPAETQAQRTASHRVDILDDRFYVFTGQKSDIEPLAEPPQLPFYGAKKNTTFDVFEIYKYINPIALFRGQWQFKRPEGMANAQFNDYLNEHALPVYERLTRELAPLIKPKVAWGYYPCSSDGNDLIIYQPDQKTEKTRFTFPRQLAGKRLCLADFFLPEGLGPNRRDTVGFSLVTVGDQVTAKERELFKKGDFQDYLFTHGLGVETAEALAEYWHRQMRMELKIDDQEPADMKLLFSAKYHGARYSFGYPACPNLEDQSKLFELLKPEEIGVELSDEYMLIPEQSTSAVVVHHPAAKYFNVR
jgi:5-methyltetrahydrofolate--homocysteine methyltransferase